MPSVKLSNNRGDSIGSIDFEWREDKYRPFAIENVVYNVTDEVARTALLGVVKDNPEGLTVFGGRKPDTLGNRLDGIYIALWWVRNHLGIDVQWKGPKLTPPEGVL